jgi:TPR repeat protein
MCNLGLMYARNRAGFDLNSKGKAEYWFRKAADQGHANAQYSLALLLSSREHVGREAFGYAMAAAKQGYPGALKLSREIWMDWYAYLNSGSDANMTAREKQRELELMPPKP